MSLLQWKLFLSSWGQMPLNWGHPLAFPRSVPEAHHTPPPLLSGKGFSRMRRRGTNTLSEDCVITL